MIRKSVYCLTSARAFISWSRSCSTFWLYSSNIRFLLSIKLVPLLSWFSSICFSSSTRRNSASAFCHSILNKSKRENGFVWLNSDQYFGRTWPWILWLSLAPIADEFLCALLAVKSGLGFVVPALVGDFSATKNRPQCSLCLLDSDRVRIAKLPDLARQPRLLSLSPLRPFGNDNKKFRMLFCYQQNVSIYRTCLREMAVFSSLVWMFWILLLVSSTSCSSLVTTASVFMYFSLRFTSKPRSSLTCILFCSSF